MRPIQFLSTEILSPMARRVAALPHWQVFLACTALTLAVGYIDFLGGAQVTISMLYAVPVSLAAWFVGRRASFVLAGLSVALWTAEDFANGIYSPGFLIPAINVVFRLAFYGLLGIALRRLSTLQSELEQRAERRAIALAHETAERERLQLQMLDISEREQRRIGQDLHDGLCQHLTGTALAGQLLAETMEANGQDAAAARKIVGLVDEAIGLARGIAKGLHPVEMQADSLMLALEDFAHTSSEMFGVQCRFECQSPVMVHEQLRATHLYRIAQEAVSNAIKHGRATNIEILLDETELGVNMAVTDNGRGFVFPPLNNVGMGLRIMADRAKMIGGTLSVNRVPESGMEIRCLISGKPLVSNMDA